MTQTVKPHLPARAPSALLLHPSDNVLVCVRRISVGDSIAIDGELILASADIQVGHKLARHALAEGEKVLRYGASIGSMTVAATKGAHVHMHNMKSDYLPSHTRSRQAQTPMTQTAE